MLLKYRWVDSTNDFVNRYTNIDFESLHWPFENRSVMYARDLMTFLEASWETCRVTQRVTF